MKARLATALLGLAVALFQGRDAAADWPMFGWSVFNTADNVGETVISRGNVARL